MTNRYFVKASKSIFLVHCEQQQPLGNNNSYRFLSFPSLNIKALPFNGIAI